MGRHVEQINAIEVANIMDGGLEAKPSVQARSQKFAMSGAVFGIWGRSPQPPEANGGMGSKPPALENFTFFCKNNLILELF